MKNLFKIIFASLLILSIQKNAFSQADIAAPGTGHAGFGFPTYYVGWDNLTNFSLNIEHRGTYDINFLLGGTQYMTIKGTSYMLGAPGSVGICTATPLALLHVDATTAAQNFPIFL
jgi:hypothetical protein